MAFCLLEPLVLKHLGTIRHQILCAKDYECEVLTKMSLKSMIKFKLHYDTVA